MNRATLWLIGAIGIIYFALASIFIWTDEKDDGRLHTISSDGVGYYSYLTNIFFESNFTNQSADGRYFVKNETGVVNKYYPGTAIFMAPFMGVGYLLEDDDSMNGFSDTYHIAISIGAILYFILGLIFLSKLLASYQLSQSAQMVVLIGIAFGTNLTNYVLEEPAMSHVYSWLSVTAFLFYYRKYHLNGHRRQDLVMTALFFGFILLIRPVNGLIIFFVPFLSDSWKGFVATLQSVFRPKKLIPTLAVVILIVSIHPILVFVQSGSVSLWTYQNEGFYFLDPALYEFLFSWRKGLFIYTPLALIGIGSSLLWFRKDGFRFLSYLIPMGVVLYILGAWWNWYYGPSFGQRPFVEYLSLVAIPLAFGTERLRQSDWKYLGTLILTLIVCLNLIQTYQYHAWILSRWDMTKEKYAYIFLKTDEKYEEILGGYHDIEPYKANFELVFSSNCIVDVAKAPCSHGPTIEVEGDLMADYSNREFNLLSETNLDESFQSERGLYAIVSIESLEIDTAAGSHSYVSIDMQDSLGVSYNYTAMRINPVPTTEINIKRTHEFKALLPPVSSAKDKIKIYVWNPKKLRFYADDLNVKLYRVD
jgi:hypothetical protein